MPDTGLTETQQKAALGRLVELFEIDLTPFGGTILRFTSTANGSTAIVFGGNTYVPIEVEVEGFEWSGVSNFPTPTLRISNVQFSTRNAVATFNDLLGAKITRLRTFRRFLDDGIDPDFGSRFPDDIYIVEQKTGQNKIFVEWELKALVDHTDKKLPGRQVLKDACSHIYRVFVSGTTFDNSKATCPYVAVDANAFFDSQDNSTVAANDQCGKRLVSCQLRFDRATQNKILPTRAFPGVGKT